jgi:PAT family beta-lactamase induction signal transducer AmpG
MFFRLTLAAFWLVAFTSATHDIAADGYYMHALDNHEQSLYVGIRSTFYRIASVLGQGLLVILAGHLEDSTGDIPFAWTVTFGVMSAFFLLIALYHQFILPRPDSDHAATDLKASTIVHDFFDTFRTFFTKENALVAILFMLLYRLPEAQLVKLINPFMLDPVDKGGLGLTTEQVGIVYGTVGIIGLTIGGILGGIAAAHGGLKRWLWPMVCAITLPDLVYVYLSYFQPENLLTINACIFIEQFGYGFGFTAYMLYLIYFSEGTHKTAHYAICTGFMALGMMLPGMMAGWLQETLGYPHFFLWTIVCCIATFAVTALIKIDPEFGKKKRP